MLNNLKAEMTRKKIKNKEIAKEINTTERTVIRKINEESDISWNEIKTIQTKFFPELKIEYLMESDINPQQKGA